MVFCSAAVIDPQLGETRKMHSVLRKKFSAFLSDRSGDVAALFGLMAIILFVMIGGAVDYGRWLHARHQTISAMDAAVLAAGRALQVDADDTSGAVAAAQAFYTSNTQTRLPLESDTINFAVADDSMSVTAAGNAFISTPFLSLININHLPILDEAGTDYSKSELAVGGNAGINIELSLMLDVTGSMSGTKIADLKTASKDLIDIVVWDDQSEYSSRVALVPFSEGVRLPTSALPAARGSLPNSFQKTVTYWHWYWGWTTTTKTYYLTPCVAERTGPQAYTDVAPGSGSYVLGVYTTSSSANCKPNSTNVLVPLSNDKASLKASIDALSTSGGTGGHLGTAWSWYTLSPNWNSLWSSSANNAVAYGTADTQKIAVLMTDGEYNRQYTDEGISANVSDAANGSSTDQARSMCTAMKHAGVIVYTVGFDLSSGSEAATTLAQCATDPSKAFTAADGDDLQQAFRAIALEISKLYLSS
ncbi:MAG: VWA domain-containing protein [Alphaproteobacteria bacterium]|nr:VWA domain-containing protein [Alphaproteobacteria bacterium]